MSKQVEKIKELIAKREQARLGGGEKAIEKQSSVSWKARAARSTSRDCWAFCSTASSTRARTGCCMAASTS